MSPRMAPKSLAAKRRRVAIADGTWEYRLPAGPVVEHVQMLHRSGMSAAAIATASGLALSVISPLVWAETHSCARQWVTRATSDALLKVTIRDTPDRAWLPSTGSRRRIEALQCMGWSQRHVADLLGATVQTVTRVKVRPLIEAGRARRIAAIYDDLAMRPGPDKRTRTWATKKGYAPPLAWDDDSIDDPAAEPVGAGYVPGSAEDRVTELEDLGLSRQQIADRLGIRRDTVDTTAQRARRVVA